MSIFVEITDGGPDHNTSYVSVKVQDMVKFISSGADCYLHERPAGGWSFQNPCEQTMSTGNLALQHVTLQRESMDDVFELKKL